MGGAGGAEAYCASKCCACTAEGGNAACGRRTCATQPASAPESMRCAGVMRSRSGAMARLMRSLQDSLMAVSGAILITLVPLPRKKARAVPDQAHSTEGHLTCNVTVSRTGQHAEVSSS
jgi:hypothetical protein